MKDITKNYKRYKWFYTSSGKLVVGGKNAEQNDFLLGKIIRENRAFIIMHTNAPGSPFCAILERVNKVDKNDIAECATFTACFSRAWKENKKRAEVDIFDSEQISKPAGAKVGTWGVKGRIRKISPELKLVLTKQKGTWKAVPEESARKDNKILAYVYPGKIDKRDLAVKLHFELGEKIDIEEIISALPSGGIRIVRKK